MRRSTSARLRGVALAAAFCVLGGGAGCGRQTFDLLPSAGTSGALSGASGASGAPSGGAGGNASGAGGGLGSNEAGTGGRAQASAGSAGRWGFPEGGTGGALPCFNGPGCMAGAGGGCAPGMPFCGSCATDNDCFGEAHYCDPGSGRCYECKGDDDCAPNETCLFTHWCFKHCKDQSDCNSDPDHRFCQHESLVCVSCITQSDCGFFYDGAVKKQKECFFNECVQCTEDRDCLSNDCVGGYCQQPH